MKINFIPYAKCVFYFSLIWASSLWGVKVVAAELQDRLSLYLSNEVMEAFPELRFNYEKDRVLAAFDGLPIIESTGRHPFESHNMFLVETNLGDVVIGFFQDKVNVIGTPRVKLTTYGAFVSKVIEDFAQHEIVLRPKQGLIQVENQFLLSLTKDNVIIENKRQKDDLLNNPFENKRQGNGVR